MKRIIALVLALLTLFSIAACAETQATRVDLDQLSISYIYKGRAKTVRFRDISLGMILGASGDVPTVQGSFDNGRGQQVDGLMQIVGNEVLFSVGGISGVYVLDLSRYAELLGGFTHGGTVAAALAQVLSMAGNHMDMILYAITAGGKNGMRTLSLNVNTDGYVSAMEGLIALIDGSEAVEDADVDELRSSVQSVNDSAQVVFNYNPASGKFIIAVSQESRTIQLEGRMAFSVEEVTFFDIGPDEERYDILNLDPEIVDQLRGEVNMIAMKFIHFADGSGLAKILGK